MYKENKDLEEKPDEESLVIDENSKKSIWEIKQRKFKYYQDLGKNNNPDDFDYKKYEFRKKLKNFLLELPFDILYIIIPTIVFIYFICVMVFL